MKQNNVYSINRSKANTFGRVATSSILLTGGAIGSCYGGLKMKEMVTDLTNPVLGFAAGVATVAIGMTITNVLENTITEKIFNTDKEGQIRLQDIYNYETVKAESIIGEEI